MEAVSFIDTLVILVVVERFMGLMTLFIGLSMALVISAVIVLARYGRDRFPFLIEEDPGQETFIYDFNVDAGSAVSMGATVR